MTILHIFLKIGLFGLISGMNLRRFLRISSLELRFQNRRLSGQDVLDLQRYCGAMFIQVHPVIPSDLLNFAVFGDFGGRIGVGLTTLPNCSRV